MNTIDSRRYLSFQPKRPPLSRRQRAVRRVTGLAALPFTLSAAAMIGSPGMRLRMKCIGLGLRGLAAGDMRRGAALIVNPLDSFRYFELPFALDCVERLTVQSYLDVSSPRLLPLLVLDRRPGLVADLLNPFADDLNETAATAAALGLASRCRFSGAFIESADFPAESFDLITSISVLEHIPDDLEAVTAMWRLLRHGGRLVLTVPCARQACDEYTNIDEYGLFSGDGSGFVYWQRYYDAATLEQRIWSVTGRPRQQRIFGERYAGHYDANVESKRTDPNYPYWLEPVMMGRRYTFYEGLEELPGMGVIAMEFVKA